MRCYDCAVADRVSEPVGICSCCGRAVCMEHAHLERLPQYYATGAGMAGAPARCRHDRPQLLCAECKVASSCCDRASRRGP